jgi:hypothetical protein
MELLSGVSAFRQRERRLWKVKGLALQTSIMKGRRLRIVSPSMHCNCCFSALHALTVGDCLALFAGTTCSECRLLQAFK